MYRLYVTFTNGEVKPIVGSMDTPKAATNHASLMFEIWPSWVKSIRIEKED